MGLEKKQCLEKRRDTDENVRKKSIQDPDDMGNKLSTIDLEMENIGTNTFSFADDEETMNEVMKVMVLCFEFLC